jgi:hypothetical protein
MNKHAKLFPQQQQDTEADQQKNLSKKLNYQQLFSPRDSSGTILEEATSSQ